MISTIPRRGWLAGTLALTLSFGVLGGDRALAQETGLTVFAAASLKNALDEVDQAFAAAQGTKVTASYAASSALAKQLEAAAPADVFISADQDWMDYVAGKGLIAAETRGDLLANRIVLIAPKDSRLGDVDIKPGFDLAALLGDGRLAMGEVKAVPAGKYGKAALEKLGAWSAVEAKVAQAENVRAALLLVSRGEAPLGIVYKTDAAADPNVKIVGTFPADSHPPIVYPVAGIAASRNAALPAYLAFLRGPAAKAAFEKQGFTVLPGKES